MKTSTGPLLATVALASLLGACGAEPGESDDSTQSAEQAVEVQVEEIASVTVGSTEITFYREEGETDISIEEQASVYSVDTPMRQLWSRDLTSLEIYLALAPDQPAPEALVAAHAAEAKALGRDNDDVIPVELDRAPLAQKSVTPQDCDVMLANPYTPDYYPWYPTYRLDNTIGTRLLCAGGGICAMQYTYPAQVVLLGICNDSSSSLPYELQVKRPDSDTWRVIAKTAKPNRIGAHYRRFTSPHNHMIVGKSASGQYYHLRTSIGSHR